MRRFRAKKRDKQYDVYIQYSARSTISAVCVTPSTLLIFAGGMEKGCDLFAIDSGPKSYHSTSYVMLVDCAFSFRDWIPVYHLFG